MYQRSAIRTGGKRGGTVPGRPDRVPGVLGQARPTQKSHHRAPRVGGVSEEG